MTDKHTLELTVEKIIQIEKENTAIPDDAKNLVERMKSKNKQVRRKAFKEARRLLSYSYNSQRRIKNL